MTKKTIIYNSTGRLKRVLLAKPTYHEILPVSDVARDLLDSGVQQDQKEKVAQYKELESALNQAEVEISWVELEPENKPWQMFTRDFGANSPHGIMIGRFRYVERKGEELVVKRTLEKIGETIIEDQITIGAVEGGDCFWLNEDMLIIGNGNRSTYSGFENAKKILSKYDKEVFVVEFLSKWNHLDMIFQPVADKLAIVCKDAIPPYFIGFLDALGWKMINVPEDFVFKCEINVLALGNDKVLSWKGNRINPILKSWGLEVYDPLYSHFCDAGGGPHCSTFELEREI